MSNEKSNTSVAEILRAATSKKPVRVPIANIVIDPTKNVREPDMSTWDVEGMAEDLALDGQKEPALLEKVGPDKFQPWRGFRRCAGVKKNADAKVIDPATGKPFDSVLAFVIDEPLSERERIALLLDQGNTRPLNIVEAFYAVERADKVWDTNAQIAVATRGLLDMFWPVKDQDILNEKDPAKQAALYANYRRGKIENLLNGARSPDVLRDLWVKKLRGEQSWPSEKEVRQLYGTFKKEMDADSSRKITRLKPGKEFLKAVKEFIAKKEEQAKNGRKPKSLAMMTGDDIKAAQSKFESRTMKIVMDGVLRKIGQDSLATLDAMLVKVESGEATPDFIAGVLDSLFVAPTEEGEEATPEE